MRVMIDLEVPTQEFDNFDDLCDAAGVEDAADLIEALKDQYDHQDYGNGYGIGRFIEDCGLLEGVSVLVSIWDDTGKKPIRTSARWGDRVSTVSSTVI